MARQPADRKTLSRRVLVEIDRDMTAKTSKVVWQHEVPIIEAIFGEGKAKLVEASTLDEGYTDKISPALLPWNKKQEAVPRPSESLGIGFVFIGDPRMEYDRLAAAYGKLPDENVLAVEKVYGRYQDGRFEMMVAGAALEDMPEGQLRSLIQAYGMEPTGGHKDMGEAERTEAAAARERYLKADRAELLRACAAAGVQLG